MSIYSVFKNNGLMRYAGAVLAVAAAHLIREGLMRMLGASLPTYITFYPVVMIVALLGGFGPGIFATIMAALLTDYLVLAPIHQFALANLSDAVGLALFSGMGVFMSVVAELYQRARRQAAAFENAASSQDGYESQSQTLWERSLLNAGAVVALLCLTAIGWQLHRNMMTAVEADQWEAHSYVVSHELDRLLSVLQDAEAGQREYLITGEARYLEPYGVALKQIDATLGSVKKLTLDNARQQQRLASLEPLIQGKLTELKETIDLRRTAGLQAASKVATTAPGRDLMAQIRQQIADLQDEEQRLLQARTASKDAEATKALHSLMAGGILSLLLLAAVFFFLKQENARRVRLEAEVRKHRDELQEKVNARTAELRQMNDSLSQQREWLQVTLSSIGDAVLATDSIGRVTFINPVAESLTGWMENEAVGKPLQSIFNIIHERTRKPAPNPVEKVLKDGKIVGLANHTAIISRDGNERSIEDSAAPIIGTDGQILGVVMVFHDVTEQRKAEIALAEQQEWFRITLGSIGDAVVTTDTQGQVTFINPVAEALTGWKLQEARGHALSIVCRLVNEQTRQTAPNPVEHCLREGRVVGLANHTLLLSRDGREIPLEDSAAPIMDGQGRIVGAVMVFKDVTERNLAEQKLSRLAAIVEGSDDAIISKTLEGTILTWNASAERMFGYHADEIVGKPITLLIPPERIAEEKQILRQIREGQQVRRLESIRLKKNGQPFHALVTSSPVKNADGQVVGASKIIRDITERKKAEEALRESEQRVRLKLESILSPEGDIGKLELADIIDVPRIQTLMENFHKLTSIPLAIIDAKGKVLVGIGWQNICTQFHRVNPESCRHCIESDTELSAGVPAGEYKFYRCKNNMWDVATPIIISGQRLGNLFTGQFFFEGETLDINLFKAQAARYGFDEKAYLLELEKVPRINKEKLAGSMAFLMKLADLISSLSYGNIKLARSLAERDAFNRTLKALGKSNQAMFRASSEAELLSEVCRIIVEDCEHAMVWIGFAEEDENKTVRPVAYAGFEEGYLETTNVTWADNEWGRGPTGTAIRTGKSCGCQNMLTDPAFLPWRAEAIKRGYTSSMVLPLLAHEKAFGAITIYSRQPDSFSEAEIKLLGDLANDLALGITAFRLRAAKAQADEQLAQANANLEQLVKARTAELEAAVGELQHFSYTITHDMRAPLRAMMSYGELLLEEQESLSLTGKNFLSRISSSAARMDQLITDALDYSKLVQEEFELQPVDLERLLREMVESYPNFHAAKAQVSIARNMPWIHANEAALTQIFSNLINNALKFVQPGKAPEIRIWAEDSGERARFWVEDNGIGVQADCREKIFVMFQRLNLKKEGTGIGLALVKKAAERMGGQVGVESELGKGSRFWVELKKA